VTNINILNQYAYPKEISTVVEQFVDIVNDIFSKQKIGILLVGSAARGELCWGYISNKLEMYSDIEFLIAIDYKNSQLLGDLKQRISELDARSAYGEAFHIDYTVIPWSKVKKVEKKFFVFESKQCGIELGKQSVRDSLPIVNRSNLNWKELNEVVLHRMNSILYAIPVSLFESKMTAIESRTFALNLAKNSLDLTTWLHPYESDKLTAGFTARTESWDKDFLKKSQFGHYFSEEDIKYIKSCLDLRKQPSSDVDVVFMLGQTLRLYTKGISYCKAMNEIDGNRALCKAGVSIKLFDEYRFRQRVSLAISLLANISKTGLIKCLRNLICVRKGIAVCFCLEMLHAVDSHLKGIRGCQSHLKIAQVELSKLTRYKEVDGGEVQIWLKLRDYFEKYQVISHNY